MMQRYDWTDNSIWLASFIENQLRVDEYQYVWGKSDGDY